MEGQPIPIPPPTLENIASVENVVKENNRIQARLEREWKELESRDAMALEEITELAAGRAADRTMRNVAEEVRKQLKKGSRKQNLKVLEMIAGQLKRSRKSDGKGKAKRSKRSEGSDRDEENESSPGSSSSTSEDDESSSGSDQ